MLNVGMQDVYGKLNYWSDNENKMSSIDFNRVQHLHTPIQ